VEQVNEQSPGIIPHAWIAKVLALQPRQHEPRKGVESCALRVN
jgi:hypothetical protein